MNLKDYNIVIYDDINGEDLADVRMCIKRVFIDGKKYYIVDYFDEIDEESEYDSNYERILK